MAKGRKLTTSRSERLLGRYGYDHSQGTATTGDVPELGEEDVWSMVDDVVNRDDDSGTSAWVPRPPESNGNISVRSRRREGSAAGGLSLAFDDIERKSTSSRIVHQFRGQDSPRGHHHMATSAPMNVPDWNRILRVDSVESMHDSDDGSDDRDWSDVIPPHEYLARSRKSAATSVFEGVGRTLKGRDLSRVRDAVWSQTGFDG